MSNYTTTEFINKLHEEIKVTPRDTVILMCAIFIASIGLNMNSTAVIIGAMLISPLMTPIIGMGTGFATYDRRLITQSFKLLVTQVFVSLVVSTLYFMLSPISYPSNEIIARTSPTIWDIMIAIAGGVAGVIGSRKKDANNIVPGVAIATALMPPICTAGFGIASGNIRFFIGALYLFMINFVFIMIVNFIGTRILMQKTAKETLKDIPQKVKITFLSLVILLVIPSLISAASLALDYAKKDAINQFIKDQLPHHTIIDKTFIKNTKTLEMSVVGELLTADQLEQLNQQKSKYGINDITIKINQILDVQHANTKTNDIYKHIDKYIESKLNTQKIKNEDIIEKE